MLGNRLHWPLYVKKNNDIVKVHVLLFTCTVFWAIHLELVDDFTANELMNGFPGGVQTINSQ